MSRKFHKRSLCPISSALDIFGDKWTLLILRDAIFERKRTFGEFLASDEKMATNILADRLLGLEHHGLLTRTKAENNRSVNIYTPTKKALALVPVLVEIIVWSDQYLEISPQAHGMAAAIREDKERVVTSLRSEQEEGK